MLEAAEAGVERERVAEGVSVSDEAVVVTDVESERSIEKMLDVEIAKAREFDAIIQKEQETHEEKEEEDKKEGVEEEWVQPSGVGGGEVDTTSLFSAQVVAAREAHFGDEAGMVSE